MTQWCVRVVLQDDGEIIQPLNLFVANERIIIIMYTYIAVSF